MKRLSAALLGLLFIAVVAEAEDTAKKNQLTDPQDRLSYSIGMDIGNNLKRQLMNLNPEIVAKGIIDALSGAPTALSEEAMRETLETFRKDMTAKQNEVRKLSADKNLKEGAAFLQANSKKPGVKTLPSGLQYKVVKNGSGKKPGLKDTVTVHYSGTLIDGTEFDSSYKRGEPVVFPVEGVIKGWTEALQLMKTGSKWQLFIPSNLAYGEKGAGRDIGPNATLLFEVELISIK